MKSLLGDPESLADNLIDYVSAFSANVADIFAEFGFEKTIRKLDENDRLYLVVDAFADDEKVDLHPSALSNAGMGQLFEHLIYKFSTASNETAGEHFTPRDAIRLMVDLLLAPDSDVLSVPGTVRTIYDPTAGTGGMLSVAEERILAMNPKAKVMLAGQELNPESYAMCKADMIGKGQDVNAIRRGDTLRNDLHEGVQFDYCLSNPPYGGDWKAAEATVRAEHLQGFKGRFGAGLPRISDGQTLFLQHLVSKMRPAQAGVDNSGGRAAIVLNGSPLFTGGAGSGESEIRRWLIESDLVDAIVALPTNMFYNTGIATYVWLLDNAKPAGRRGRIQLIDASGFGTKMRKNLGSKNKELRSVDRKKIAQLYDDFEDGELSKILEPADFGYWEITVEQPLRLRFEVDADNTDAVLASKPLAKLDKTDAAAIRAALGTLIGQVFMVAKRLPDRTAQGHDRRARATVGADPQGDLDHDRRPRRRRRDLPRRQEAARTRPRPARHRTRAVPRHHRGLLRPRGETPRPGRLDRPFKDQDRLRDPLHPAVLQVRATPIAGGDRRRPQPGHRGDPRTPAGGRSRELG